MPNAPAGGSETASLIVSNATDWTHFPSEKLDVIVDPMIFRSGHLLLRGPSGALGSPEDVWQRLYQNLGSLITFFDALILNERLPLIDLGFTFGDMVVQDLTRYCNQYEQILTAVHVTGPAYDEAKNDAIATLSQRRQLPSALAAIVRAEMSTFDYIWDPYIPEIDTLQSDDEKALLRFMFGGLLFGTYAKRSGAGHLMQPGRSKLYLAASLARGPSLLDNEEELFQEMKKMASQMFGSTENTFDLEALPHFLPYLLGSKPKTPLDLLKKALSLRKNGAVRDYRMWRLKLLRNWRDDGHIDPNDIKEINRITQAVKRELKRQGNLLSEVELKLTFVGIVPTTGIPIPIGTLLNDLWDWTAGVVPGHRYSKLLMRMLRAGFGLRKIEVPLRRLWERA